MRTLSYIMIVLLLSSNVISCNPEAMGNDIAKPQACCDEEEPILPPPPPPPPTGGRTMGS